MVELFAFAFMVWWNWPALQIWMFTGARAAQAVPKMINYQARITDTAGVPVPDGVLNVKITLYDQSATGTCLYTVRGTCGAPTSKSVTVTGGVFSTLIGDTASGDNAIPDTLFDSPNVFLGVSIGADSEMTPRKQIGSSGFAMNAGHLANLTPSSTGGSGAYVPVTDSAGGLTVTGLVKIAGSTNPTSNLLQVQNGNDSTRYLTVSSTSTQLAGDLLPTADNTYNLGTSSFRWKTLNVGPGSVVVRNDPMSTLTLGIVGGGALGQLISGGEPLQITTGANTGLNIDSSGRIGIGTASPITQLHVIGTVPTSALSTTFISGSFPTGFAVQGRYLYQTVVNGNQFKVFDVSNPSSPTLVSTLSVTGSPRSIDVRGHLAYLDGDGGVMMVIDVSNPASPTILGSASVSGAANSAYGIASQGRYVYRMSGFTAESLQIFDVSNPNAPVEISHLGSTGCCGGLVANGRYVYIAENHCDIGYIHDEHNHDTIEQWHVGDEAPLAVTDGLGNRHVIDGDEFSIRYDRHSLTKNAPKKSGRFYRNSWSKAATVFSAQASQVKRAARARPRIARVSARAGDSRTAASASANSAGR